MQSDDDVAQLARFTLAHQRGEYVFGADALTGLLGALNRETDDDLLKLPGRNEVTDNDTLAGLRLLHRERERLDFVERELIEAAKNRGVTWERLGAEASGRGYGREKPLSPQAMQQRYKRLGGTQSWPTPPPQRGKEPERCPSLLLHNGQLHQCQSNVDHHEDAQTLHMAPLPDSRPQERLTWRDHDAVPSPWPADQEPAPGINILHSPSAGGLSNLARTKDGKWLWCDHNGAWGAEAQPWKQAVRSAGKPGSDLVVVLGLR